MIVRVLQRLTFLTVGGYAAVMLSGSKPAHAERIISDYEASKLTLESLTAAPVYHPVHHVAFTSRSSGRRFQEVSAHRNLVHLVAFHTVKRSGSSAHTRHRT